MLVLLVVANYNLTQDLEKERQYSSVLKESVQALDGVHIALAKEVVTLSAKLEAKKSPPAPQIPSNNPGNIVKGVDWQGEVACKGRFECFKSPEHGIRAIGKLLHTYKTKHNLNTVEEIITRWAPPHENNTAEFIKFVKRAVRGSTTNTHNFVKAIITFEQGRQPYSDETISRGLGLV